MKVKSFLQHIFVCSDENIMPGINYVKNPKFFEHPAVIARVKKGTLQVEKGADALDKKSPSLSQKSSKDLIEDMPEVNNLAALNELSQDPRTTVSIAAKEQLSKITGE